MENPASRAPATLTSTTRTGGWVVDERVEEVEDFVDALREDSEPLDALILFVEMILDGYEVYRSMTQVYYFITQFFQALVNSYTAINSFLEAVNLPSLDLGL